MRTKIKEIVDIPQPAWGHEWLTPAWWAAIHEIETIYGEEVEASPQLADSLIEEADRLLVELGRYAQLHMALTRRRLRIDWIPMAQVDDDEDREAEERCRYHDVPGMARSGEIRERLDDGLREVMGRLEVEATAYRQAGNGLRRLCEETA